MMRKQPEPKRRARPYIFTFKKPNLTYPNGLPVVTQAWRKEQETVH
jgi:hypothetical protein